jgi:hypothetical protein
MDHDDVLEHLELAAVEPGGLDRLIAGDTPMAAAVVTHVAGCESCAEELRRLSRAAPLLRDVVRTTPPDDLRERTLGFVREHGRERGEAAIEAVAGRAPVATMGARGAGGTRAETMAGRRMTRRLPRVLPWVATIAAGIALTVSAAGFLASRDLAERVASQTAVISALERVQRATLDLTGEPGTRRVELVSTGGGDTTGTLLFSPSTSQLVVVAYDLARPPSGQEYRCWVEIDGQRKNVGKMFFADELAFWVGKTPEVGNLPDGSVFGVSAAAVGSPSLEADPVIRGEL